MSVPEFQNFMLPILKIFEDKKEHSIKECREIVIKNFSLSDSDIKELVPSGKQTLVENRVYWSITYLKKSLLIKTVNRGVYCITSRGLDLLKTKPLKIDKKLLSQYKEYRIFSNQEDAKGYVEKVSQNIVLINGKTLTKLMIENNVGVQINYTYSIKKIDNDYFEMI